jgi:hypothetical protein
MVLVRCGNKSHEKKNDVALKQASHERVGRSSFCYARKPRIKQLLGGVGAPIEFLVHARGLRAMEKRVLLSRECSNNVSLGIATLDPLSWTIMWVKFTSTVFEYSSSKCLMTNG